MFALINHQSPTDLEQDEPMIYRFHHTIILAVAVCLCGALIELNANMSLPGLIVAQAMPVAEQETFSGWPFFMLGSLIGGFAIVGFRRLKDNTEAARYFGVSVAGSWLLAPTLVLDFKMFGLVQEPKWQTCLAASGAAAMIAWTILEIATMFLTSCNKAYECDGIVGLRNHLIMVISIGAIRMNSMEKESSKLNGQSTISPGQTNATPPPPDKVSP